MRINAIDLEWFRGAAATATLALNSKSMVVYGENGAGKSSFVDAIEYVLNSGRVGHLTHEYSRKRQQKGLVNTHRPIGKPTRLWVSFSNGSRLVAEVQPHGASTLCGSETEAVLMHTWNYRRTVVNGGASLKRKVKTYVPRPAYLLALQGGLGVRGDRAGWVLVTKVS